VALAVTELAYLAEPSAAYVREFSARVTALPPGAVVLDRTFFYPTGGGQPADRGDLRTSEGLRLEVVDVTRSGASVLHRVKGAPSGARPLRSGEAVTGQIDWDRRHRHMRLHTGQHLLSARIFARAGLRTRRANLAGSDASLDLEGPLSEEFLGPLRDDLRDAVLRPHPVTVRFVPRAEWDRHPYAGRSGLVPLPAHVDPVRIIEIEATDACPCGGTHLRSTAELGPVELAIAPGSGGGRVRLTIAELATPTPAP
jgi:misacylated tRNA(Ala) deacylase